MGAVLIDSTAPAALCFVVTVKAATQKDVSLCFLAIWVARTLKRNVVVRMDFGRVWDAQAAPRSSTGGSQSQSPSCPFAGIGFGNRTTFAR